MELDVDRRRIALTAPTTATPLVRQIPGARHDSKRQLWTLPLSWATCVVARGVLGGTLEVGPDLNAWAAQDRETRREPALTMRDAKDVDRDSGYGVMLSWIEGQEASAASEARALSGAPRRLYSYQRPAAAFMAVAGSALLGDDMGVGKTPTAIRAVQLLAERDLVTPILVVTPNSAKHQWAQRFAEWAPSYRVEVAKSGTVACRKAVAEVAEGNADVLVMNWEAIANLSRLAPYGSIELQGCTDCDPLSTRPPSRCQRSDKELNAVPWVTVIADEVHRAALPKSQQTRALWAVGDKATYRFGLTGSPPEKPDRLWCVMRFVSPDEYPVKGGIGEGGPSGFLGRYAVMSANMWSGYPEPTGLKPETRAEFDKFFLPRFMRRPYEIVDATEPVRERRDVELTGKQLKAYKDFKKNLLAEVENGVIFSANPLTKVLRLRQLASAFGEATEGGGMRLSEPSSKLDVLDDVLEELGDRQAVIFAESSQLLNLLAARFEKREIRFGRIMGEVSPEDRAEAVHLFGGGSLQYMLCTVGAGGEAVDGLQVTNTAIFLQRPWSAQLDVQAEGRIRRSGQEGTPLFIDLVTRDTVEDRVLAALADKATKLEEIVHDADTLRSWLS